MGYCINCGDEVRETGFGECPYCGADLRAARQLIGEFTEEYEDK